MYEMNIIKMLIDMLIHQKNTGTFDGKQLKYNNA